MNNEFNNFENEEKSNYDENKYFEFNDDDNETNIEKSKKKIFNNDDSYNDGEENRPKMLLMIGIGIVVLIIIIIMVVACSKTSKKSTNNYLSNLDIIGGEIEPSFTKDVSDYNIYASEEFISIKCSAEDSKSSTTGCNKNVFITDECQTNQITVISQSNSKRVYNLNICKGSKTIPQIKDVTVDPETETEVATVTIYAECSIDLHQKAYSIDNGVTWQASNVFKVKENKTLYIKVRNGREEISNTYEKDITNITNQKISVKLKGSIESGKQTSSNVQLTTVVTPSNGNYTYTWYKNGNKISGATSSTYNATSKGKYKVVVSNAAGKKATSNEFYVNKTSGTSNYTLDIIGVSGNPTTWTNKNITLTVNVKTSNGLAAKGYSFDNGKTYQSSNSKTITGNGTINIKVKDKNGNTSSYNVYVTKIDKTTPVVKTSGEYYVGNKISSIVTPSTTASGYKYQWYKNNNIISGATTSTYTPKAEGTYKLVVTTGSGTTASSSDILVTTKVVPTVVLSGNVTSGKETTGSVKLTATVKNGTATKFVWYKNGLTYSSCTTSTCTVSTSGTYRVKAYVNSKYTDLSNLHTVKIAETSTKAPTISFKANLNSYTGTSYTEGNWTNKDVYITVTGTAQDGKTIKDMYFQYLPDDSKNNKWYNGSTNAWGSKTISGSTGTAKIYFDKSNPYFKVKVVDSNGNETIKSFSFKIDKIAPYTPRPTKYNIIECYGEGDSKSTTSVPKDRKNRYCHAQIKTNFNLGLTEEDDESGISRCEVIWYSVKSTGGVYNEYGKFNKADVIISTTPYKFTNWDTMSYYDPSKITDWGTVDKILMVQYAKRCVDKAGNVGKTMWVVAFK